MKALRGKFDGKVVVLDDPAELQVDQSVVVIADVRDESKGGAVGAADFDRALDELFAADTRALPPLPLSLSRVDLYADHD